jgi:hypothetical protein
MISDDPKQYIIVCYMKVEQEPEDIQPMTFEQARKEIKHLNLLQPENIYKIESLDPEEASFGEFDA